MYDPDNTGNSGYLVHGDIERLIQIIVRNCKETVFLVAFTQTLYDKPLFACRNEVRLVPLNESGVADYGASYDIAGTYAGHHGITISLDHKVHIELTEFWNDVIGKDIRLFDLEMLGRQASDRAFRHKRDSPPLSF